MGNNHPAARVDTWSALLPELRATIRRELCVLDRMRLRRTARLNAREEYTPAPAWCVVQDKLLRRTLTRVLRELDALCVLDLLLAERLFATATTPSIRAGTGRVALSFDIESMPRGQTLHLLVVPRYRPMGNRPKRSGRDRLAIAPPHAGVSYAIAAVTWRAATTGGTPAFFIYKDAPSMPRVAKQFPHYFTPEARRRLGLAHTE